MAGSEGGIGEALGRVAESFGRLVVRHLELLRTELEHEAEALKSRAQTGALAVGRALPFAVAGVVLVSFGVAELVGLALSPLLGALARPVSLVLFGTAEASIAVVWLRRSLTKRSRIPEALPLSEPPRFEQPLAPPPVKTDGGPARPPSDGREMRYGAVGRA